MDTILRMFLDSQLEEGMELAAQSDLLDLQALDPQRFIARYSCRGLVRDATGEVREHERFAVGIWFPETYQRFANPAHVLTWLEPEEVWHPNVRPPFICAGKIAPGTPLTDLLHRCYEIITYDNVTMIESDALNHAACAWARRHRECFPIDPRPIKRQAAPLVPLLPEVRP